MNDFVIPTKFDLRYTDEKVCFSISDCSLDKNYSFWNLNREQAKEFIDKLRYIEQMTWKQLISKPRGDGLTPETQHNHNFGLIDSQNTCANKMTERYYFHFRVKHTDKFRVFGYQRNQFFCITHIDPKGEIDNH